MRTIATTITLAAALSFGGGGGAGAQTTKWVDQTSGSDANDGDSEGTAYATLQFAIDESDPGTATIRSVINVKDGTYGVTGNPTACEGWPTAILIKDLDYLTIQAVPGHEPAVKPVTAIGADIVSITVDGSDHLIIDNIDSDQTVAQFDNWHFCSDDLTVRNSRFEGGEDGIDFSADVTSVLIESNAFIDINTGSGDEVLDFTDASSSGVVIQDNLFQNNYRQITIFPPGGETASGFLIQRNVMDGTTSQEAVRLIGADAVQMINNVVMNSTQQGLYIDDGSSNIDVLFNTFYMNGEEQIRTKVATADIVIKNNIINSDGVKAAISANTASLPSLPGEDFNLIFNEGAGTESSSQGPVTTFGANTITGMDPLFVDTTPGSENLDLQADSPAIEAAMAGTGVADDILMRQRPDPAATDPDMGAYEAPGTGGPDHYVLYEANESRQTPSFVPQLVTLADQFEDGVFEAFKLDELGNPAEKTVDDETTEITNADVHLVAYKIKEAPGEPQHQKVTDILVTNQFGEIELETIKPDRLLVPSAKSLEGPVLPLDDPAVDHFKCYMVKVMQGTPAFEGLTVAISDQFQTDRLLDVQKPERLCNPVDKNGEGILDPDSHLLCYKVHRAQGERPFGRVNDVHVNNQFGPLQLDARQERELCLPSTKEVLGNP